MQINAYFNKIQGTREEKEIYRRGLTRSRALMFLAALHELHLPSANVNYVLGYNYNLDVNEKYSSSSYMNYKGILQPGEKYYQYIISQAQKSSELKGCGFMGIMIIDPSDEIVEHILEAESYVPYVYDANVGRSRRFNANEDSLGEGDWTIGFGHKIQSEEELERFAGKEITKEEASKIFEGDLDRIVNASFVEMLKRENICLTQGQFDAMVSFSFRTGEYIWNEGNMKGEEMREFILRGDYSQKELEIAYAVYMGMNAEEGNIIRSRNEMMIFLHGDYEFRSNDGTIAFELIKEYYPQYWNEEYEKKYQEYLGER